MFIFKKIIKILILLTLILESAFAFASVSGYQVDTHSATMIGKDEVMLIGKNDSLSSRESLKVGFNVQLSEGAVQCASDINGWEVSAGTARSGEKFYYNLKGLKPGTKYYYRACGYLNINGRNERFHGRVLSFTTKEDNENNQTLNGQCGDFKNTCVRGTVFGESFSNNVYRWQCSGVNGGRSVSCEDIKEVIVEMKELVLESDLRNNNSNNNIEILKKELSNLNTNNVILDTNKNDEVKIKIKDRGSLFGFIDIEFEKEVLFNRVDKNIEYNLPWYHFLIF